MSEERRTIDKLRLVNFTAFKDLTMEFSPGINAIIGENATGKTHVLKAMKAVTEKNSKNYQISLKEVFQPSKDQFQRLRHRGASENAPSNICFTLSDSTVELTSEIPLELDIDFENEAIMWKTSWSSLLSAAPYNTFIPAKDILANTPGFRSLIATREIHFDKTYLDLIDRVFLHRLKELTGATSELLELISDLIGGEVVQMDEEFFIAKPEHTIEMSLVAEGHRKFALLWLLIRNGSIRPGSILFWDEPEANLNPKLVKESARIMLMLVEMGVQIFFATHNYVVLKWLDLLAEEQHEVRYHALYRNEEGDIKCESKATLAELQQNAILDVYEEMYNAELERTIDRIGDDES